MQKENEEESPFDFLNGIKDEEPIGEDEKPEEEKPVTLSQKEYNELLGKIDKVSKSTIDESKLASILEGNDKLEQMRKIFVPDDREQSAKEKRAMEDAFDADPVGFMRKIVQEETRSLSERQERSEVDRFAKEVMSNIDREYAVDWDKDGGKIAAELALMDKDFKRKDPKKATISAMKLAGVGEKRKTPFNLPMYESSDYAAQQAKMAETEADSYKKGLFAAAKEMNRSPLDGFLR